MRVETTPHCPNCLRLQAQLEVLQAQLETQQAQLETQQAQLETLKTALAQLQAQLAAARKDSSTSSKPRSRSRQSCNTLYSMRGVRVRAHPLTGVLSLIRWNVE